MAYSEEVKVKTLGVDKETIQTHTVVSKEVALELAEKCREKFGSDYALATTGNAGPTKDKTDKSVGVVFVAVAGPSGSSAQEFFFGTPREKVIERASVKALEMVHRNFLKNQKNSLFD